MKYLKQPSSLIRLQAGFTLLELVLVLFLIGLLASAGLLFTENIESQQQYEETVERYERIRKAIIQSGERTINGRPELRGFAVDMGRLPYCLAELLYTKGRSGSDFVSPCDETVTMAGPAVSEQGIRSGWHGPYIQVSPDQDGQRYYRDGYANGANDAINSGWVWELYKDFELANSSFDISDINNSGLDPEPALYLYLQSEGFDENILGDNYPAAAPDEDNPASFMINQSSWTVPTSSRVVVTFTTSESATDFSFVDEEWQYDLTNGHFETGISGLFTHTTDSISSTTLNPGDTVQASAPLKIDDITPVPAGWYLLDINCTDTTGCGTNQSVSSPMKIMISPDHDLAPIRWKIAP